MTRFSDYFAARENVTSMADTDTVIVRRASDGAIVEMAKTDLATEVGSGTVDTAAVTAAGALMDSEVDADIKTLSLPANTTISTYGATLVDDADAATARATLGLGTAATSASTAFAPAAGDDEAYGPGWNGATDYPTKNAVYDKIETVSGGSGGTFWYLIAASNASAAEKAVADIECDGSADNVQIQAALDAGRAVLLSTGVFDCSSPIAMPSAGHISGVSMFGTVVRASNITTGDRALFVSKNNTAVAFTIENMSLDGDYAAGGPCHGIRLRNTGQDALDPPALGSDNWTHLRNLFIEGFRDATTTYHGIWLESANTTARSHNVHNVSIRECGGHGLYVDGSSDNVFSNMHIGATRSHGFHVAGANNRFTNCKSFYADTAGFHITSTRNTFAGIEAQDMGGDGIYIGGNNTTIAGVNVDANNSGRNCTSGIEIAASFVNVTGAMVRIGSGTMDEAIRFTSGSDMMVQAVINNVAADFDTAQITGSTPVDSVVQVVRPGTTPLVAP